jgi:hypothetical protein
MADLTTSVFKYLDRIKTRKATLNEATNNVKPFDKYYRNIKVRRIEKIPKTITLKKFTYSQLLVQGATNSLVFQYNLTFDNDFYILNLAEEVFNIGGCLTVKYRVGTTVYRYFLYGSMWTSNKAFNDSLFQVNFFPAYNQQLIKKNCVFEFWMAFDLNLTPAFIGLQEDFIIKTNKYVNPGDINQTLINVDCSNVFTKEQFGVAVPEVIPYNQNTQVWLDNV